MQVQSCCCYMMAGLARHKYKLQMLRKPTLSARSAALPARKPLACSAAAHMFCQGFQQWATHSGMEFRRHPEQLCRESEAIHALGTRLTLHSRWHLAALTSITPFGASAFSSAHAMPTRVIASTRTSFFMVNNACGPCLVIGNRFLPHICCLRAAGMQALTSWRPPSSGAQLPPSGQAVH